MKSRFLLFIFALITLHTCARAHWVFCQALQRDQLIVEWTGNIHEAATKYNIDPHLLWTVGYMESRFRIREISPKGARGPFQFMPDTARSYGLKNPHNFRESAFAAAHLLRDLTHKYSVN